MTLVPQAQRKGTLALYTAIMVFFVGLVVLLFAAGINGATQGSAQAQVATVITQRIKIQDGYMTPVKVYGLVESSQVADIAFDTGGQVTEIYVDEGDVVNAGEVIALLDSDRLNARMMELHASLERAQADLTLAHLTEKRITQLVNKGLESSQRLDEAQANVASLSAQVKEIQASINSMKVEQAKTMLIAPFSGTVSTRYIDKGGVVAGGTPLLKVTSHDLYQARFAVPADIISLFSVGETVNVSVSDVNIKGQIAQLSPVRNRQTRTIDILVNLSSNRGVRPGDTAVLTGEKFTTAQGAWVPVSALSNGLRGLWRVFVVLERAAPTLESRTVEVVYTDGQRAYVRGALADGEVLVSHGTHKLSAGQVVKIKPAHVQGANE